MRKLRTLGKEGERQANGQESKQERGRKAGKQKGGRGSTQASRSNKSSREEAAGGRALTMITALPWRPTEAFSAMVRWGGECQG